MTRLLPRDFFVDLQKQSVVQFEVNGSKRRPLDTSVADKWMKGKGKGFRTTALPLHIALLTGRWKEQGVRQRKTQSEQQMQRGKGKGADGNAWTWCDLWSESWKGRSGVHSVEERSTRDDLAMETTSVLLGLETTTSSTEEDLNIEETVRCEDDRCRREGQSML